MIERPQVVICDNCPSQAELQSVPQLVDAFGPLEDGVSNMLDVARDDETPADEFSDLAEQAAHTAKFDRDKAIVNDVATIILGGNLRLELTMHTAVLEANEVDCLAERPCKGQDNGSCPRLKAILPAIVEIRAVVTDVESKIASILTSLD